MPVEKVEFMSGDLRLEGQLHRPNDSEPVGIVVVCHPHPLRGGDMNNYVVSQIAQALVAANIAALAFNFRGVGRSEGQHDNGAGEQDDVRAALAYARSELPDLPIGLAGYSFGAGMAARVAGDSLAAIALVSPPTRMLDAAASLWSSSARLLLISGDSDPVSNVAEIDTYGVAKGSAAFKVVPGADHFWFGHEAELRQAVGRHFETAFASLPT